MTPKQEKPISQYFMLITKHYLKIPIIIWLGCPGGLTEHSIFHEVQTTSIVEILAKFPQRRQRKCLKQKILSGSLNALHMTNFTINRKFHDHVWIWFDLHCPSVDSFKSYIKFLTFASCGLANICLSPHLKLTLSTHALISFVFKFKFKCE